MHEFLVFKSYIADGMLQRLRRDRTQKSNRIKAAMEWSLMYEIRKVEKNSIKEDLLLGSPVVSNHFYLAYINDATIKFR